MLKNFAKVLKENGYVKSHSKYGISLYRKGCSGQSGFEIGVMLIKNYPKSHSIEVEVGLYCSSIEETFAKMSGIYERLGAMWLTFCWRSIPSIPWEFSNDELFIHTINENQIKFIEERLRYLSENFDQISFESLRCLSSMECNQIFMNQNYFISNLSRYAIYYVMFNFYNGEKLEDLFVKSCQFFTKENHSQYESFIRNFNLFKKYVAEHSLKAGFLKI